MNISVIGGDKRMATVAECAADDGNKVLCCGLDNYDFSSACLMTDSIKMAVSASDIIILPLPVSRDGSALFAPLSRFEIGIFDIVNSNLAGKVFLGGVIDNEFAELLRKKGAAVEDYFKREELNIINAVSTIEGAIEICMRETDSTVFGSRVLIVGYGRLGKVAAEKFAALGGKVTVSARRQSDLAWINIGGYQRIETADVYKHIGRFDIVINTVPSLVIGKKELDSTDKNCLIVDLASLPGGIDFDYAKKKNLKTVHALSLPGKTSPKSAGKAVYDTVINMLYEMKKPN